MPYKHWICIFNKKCIGLLIPTQVLKKFLFSNTFPKANRPLMRFLFQQLWPNCFNRSYTVTISFYCIKASSRRTYRWWKVWSWRKWNSGVKAAWSGPNEYLKPRRSRLDLPFRSTTGKLHRSRFCQFFFKCHDERDRAQFMKVVSG